MAIPKYMKKIMLPVAALAVGAFLSMAPASTAHAQESKILQDKFVSRNYIGPNAVQSFVQFRHYEDEFPYVGIIDWKYDYGKTLRVGDDIYFSFYLDKEGTLLGNRRGVAERKSGAFGIYKYNIPSKKMTRVSNKALLGMVYYDGYLYGIEAQAGGNQMSRDSDDTAPFDYRKYNKYEGTYKAGRSLYYESFMFDQVDFCRINVETGKRQFLGMVEELYYKSTFDGKITYTFNNSLFTMNLDGSGKKFCGRVDRNTEYLGYTTNNRMIVEKGIGTPTDAFYELNVKTGKCKKIMDNTNKMKGCFIYEDNLMYASGKKSIKAYSLKEKKNNPAVASLMKSDEYRVGNYQDKKGKMIYSEKQHSIGKYTLSIERNLEEGWQRFYLQKENKEREMIGEMETAYCSYAPGD